MWRPSTKCVNLVLFSVIMDLWNYLSKDTHKGYFSLPGSSHSYIRAFLSMYLCSLRERVGSSVRSKLTHTRPDTNKWFTSGGENSKDLHPLALTEYI